MADYIPRLQTPDSLAAQTGQMGMQNALIIPNAVQSALQSVVQGIMQGHQNKLQREQNSAYSAILQRYFGQQDEQATATPAMQPAPQQAQPAQPTPTGNPFAALGNSSLPLPAHMISALMAPMLAGNRFQNQMTMQKEKEGAAASLAKTKVSANQTELTDEMLDSVKVNGKTLRGLGYEAGEPIKNSLLAGWTKPAATGGAGRSLGVDKFVETELDKANRAVNPINAPRGSVLGTAGLMKTRIDTARDNLNDPTMTPQQLASVGTDLAGIVQMGSPHENGIKDQDYQTWYTKAKALSGRIMNKTEPADSPKTVAKLKDILNGYDRVYNKVIHSNLDAFKASKASMIKKYPEFGSSFDGLEKDIRGKYPLDAAPAAGAGAAPAGGKFDVNAHLTSMGL